MKKILSLFAVAAFTLTAFAQESGLEQLGKLKAEAKKDSKLVMVKFLMLRSLGAGASFPNDYLMQKNVFLNTEISSLIGEKYLSMSVTKFKTDGKLSPILVELKVNAWPTVVIVNADGEEVHRLKGFNEKKFNAKELIAKLNELSKDNAKEEEESKVEDKKAK
jgi:hypothetical protein